MKNAREGAMFMDEHCPGWHNEVDPKTVNVGHANKCPLGQKYGDYTTGCRELHLSKPKRFQLGFHCPPCKTLRELSNSADASLEKNKRAYKILTKYWRGEIRSRRKCDRCTPTTTV